MDPKDHHRSQSEFIGQIQDRIGDHHLFDQELTVGKILRLVLMSRTDFHRKIKRETGLSATAYIRRERLHRAKKILAETPEMPVGRVAGEVGFANHSYFTRKFREMFGYRPEEVRKKPPKE